MLWWLAAASTAASAAHIFRDLIVVLLFLFPSTVPRGVRFASVVAVFVGDTGRLPFPLMNAFGAGVGIDGILVRILDIDERGPLVVPRRLFVVVCGVDVAPPLVLSLLPLLVLSPQLLLPASLAPPLDVLDGCGVLEIGDWRPSWYLPPGLFHDACQLHVRRLPLKLGTFCCPAPCVGLRSSHTS